MFAVWYRLRNTPGAALQMFSKRVRELKSEELTQIWLENDLNSNERYIKWIRAVENALFGGKKQTKDRCLTQSNSHQMTNSHMQQQTIESREIFSPIPPQISHNLLDALLEYPIRNEEGR